MAMASMISGTLPSHTPDVRILSIPQTQTEVALTSDAYRVRFGDQNEWSRSRTVDPLVRLRYQDFDPLQDSPPDVPDNLLAREEHDAYIVQFHTQVLDDYRQQLEKLGVQTYQFIPSQSLVVRMNADTRAQVEQLESVRWVGEYHPAYKIAPDLKERMDQNNKKKKVVFQLLKNDKRSFAAIKALLNDSGAEITKGEAGTHVLESTLSNEQIIKLARRSEVLNIDYAYEPVTTMDNARAISGADTIETNLGYTGTGVAGEVMDEGLSATHDDFQNNPPTIHGSAGTVFSHGVPVFGIVFGDGTSDSQARGIIPDGIPFFSQWSPPNRLTHTEELVDPNDIYRAVFQTNSWGNGTAITTYHSLTSEIDNVVFETDLLTAQAFGNQGTTSGNAQGKAKNVVTVGGVRHQNTLSTSDDAWNNSATIGPASDGRIKPDLTHFYDDIYTTSSTGNSNYRQFSGTSGATPITAGHFGLLFEMYADGVFDGGPGLGRDVFDARPHAATAKALMINAANQYTFDSSSTDLIREHQGWGMADIENLYDIAQENGWELPLLIDETDTLRPLSTNTYEIEVTDDNGDLPWLKATMVYTDESGTTSASQHRINDLTLEITSPSGTTYYGNVGLDSGNWSTSGGSANTIDNVENVFIENAETGTWTIEVHGDDIVQDTHTETGALDADYALVLTCEGAGLCAEAAPPAAACSVPSSGDWTVTSDCSITTSETAPASVTVQSGVTLYIEPTGQLDIDMNNQNITVEQGGRTIIEDGGKIY